MPTRLAISAFIALVLGADAISAAGVRTSFLYSLGDTAVKRSMGWAAMSWDAGASELYVVSGGVVGIYDDNGLATFSFGDEENSGMPVAAVALDSGEIVILAAKDETWSLVRCSYRGEPLAKLELALPEEFRELRPNLLVRSGETLYLADREQMKVVAIKPDGSLVKTWDLAQLFGIAAKDRSDAMMRGFSVDRAGDLLVTCAGLFRAFVVTPEGRVREFGTKGSSPGKFNVVSGIAADDEGHLYLTDALRSVVMVFDASLQFLGEFGDRGDAADCIAAPFTIAAGGGRVYVAQARGALKAFAVRFD